MKHCSVLFLAAAACGAPSTSFSGLTFDPCAGISAQVSADATDSQAQGVRDAVALWQQVATISLSAEPGMSVVVPVSFQTAAALDHGAYEADKGDVLINDDLSNDPTTLAIVIAHELGHSMGLVHVKYDSVMQVDNLAITPQSADAEALTQLWGQCSGDGSTASP